MDIGFETIGNATVICHDRRPILVTDPWVQGGAYFGSWKLSHAVPEAQMAAVRDTEFAWFSHGHPDHLNGECLPLFAGKKILVADHVGQRIRRDLTEQGYSVRVLPDRRWLSLSPRVRVLCIADYNQDAVLLIDVNGRLVVNLNDASDRGWGRTVRRIIKGYDRSFLLALHGFGDADMINFFDESGQRLPIGERAPLGQTIAAQAEHYGVRYFIPFSSMHRYQRADSAWAAAVSAKLEDYPKGFRSSRVELLPAFIRWSCADDTMERIDPPETPEHYFEPTAFGDDWSEPLERDELRAAETYFRRIERLEEAVDFIRLRIGGNDHVIGFPRKLARRGREKGLTIEAPRGSFTTSIKYEIFDDLLIGNFAKVTLHGEWIGKPLYPDFTPYVAKYGDNGKARTRSEVEDYFSAYRRRDPAGYLGHLVERNWLLPVQTRAADALRKLGTASPIYQAAKKTYWALRRAGG